MSLENSPTFVNDAGLKYFSLDGADDYGKCDGTITGSVEATPTNLGVNGAVPRSIVCVAKLKNGVGHTAGGLYDLGNTGVAGQHMSLRRNGDTTADPSSFRNNYWSTPDHDFITVLLIGQCILHHMDLIKKQKHSVIQEFY